MKKLLIALLLVLSVGLFGCGSDNYYDEYEYDYDYDDSYDSGSSYYEGCESLVILGYTPSGYTLSGTNDCGDYVTVYVTDYYDWRSGYGTDDYGNFVEFIYW